MFKLAQSLTLNHRSQALKTPGQLFHSASLSSPYLTRRLRYHTLTTAANLSIKHTLTHEPDALH